MEVSSEKAAKKGVLHQDDESLHISSAVLIQAQCPLPGPSCPIQHEIDKRIDERINCAVSAALAKVDLDCTTAITRSADTSCPSGYKAISCACGMACGSWDIRGESACHCQCAGIDWTSARCCRVR